MSQAGQLDQRMVIFSGISVIENIHSGKLNMKLLEYTRLMWKTHNGEKKQPKNGILWIYPRLSKSHHQDYYVFSSETLETLHLPLLLGGGHIPSHTFHGSEILNQLRYMKPTTIL